MLIPLTRKTLEELIPSSATGDQYRYCWGKTQDVIQRVLYSVGGVLLALVFNALPVVPDWLTPLEFTLAIAAGTYWLWGPVYLASRRNREYRKYKYSGFWQGEVVDVFVTENLVDTKETVNKQGELVVTEDRERRFNLEVEDESGFATQLQVPLQKVHKAVRPGDRAQMVVLSNRDDLSRIGQVTDIFIPDHDLWVSDYPYLQRDAFLRISRQARRQADEQPPKRTERRSERPKRPERLERQGRSPDRLTERPERVAERLSEKRAERRLSRPSNDLEQKPPQSRRPNPRRLRGEDGRSPRTPRFEE